MDPLLHAETLEYLCRFRGGMEDPNAKKQMLQKVLAIKEQHFGEHDPEVAFTLNNLAHAHMKLGNSRMGKDLLVGALKIFQDHWREEHWEANTLTNAMESRLCREKQLPIVDANATVVVNIFTLEIAVEDVSTECEAKATKTAHQTLLEKAGWTRPYCFGGAVQKGKFRPVSGFPERPSRGILESHRTRLRRATCCPWDARDRHSLRRIRSLQEVHKGQGKHGEGSDSGGSGPCRLAPGRTQRARSQKGVVLHGPLAAPLKP